jgi:molecular chaperone GrpE (heat shock protein)
MIDISDLESRIVTALDRIQAGAARLAAPRGDDEVAAPDPAVIADLEQRLADERLANAQLEDRVKVLKERQETKLAALEGEVAAERDRVQRMDADLQRLRQSTAEMRELVAQLRSAVTDGLAEPELVNRAILAELDAVKALRDADRGELEAILQELRPIIEEAQ